jgi:hypothetical protein
MQNGTTCPVFQDALSFMPTCFPRGTDTSNCTIEAPAGWNSTDGPSNTLEVRVGHGNGVPQTPLQLIEGALDDLGALVTLRVEPGASTHTAIIASGVEQPAATLALGRYLTGALAGAIGADARLSAQLLGTTTDARAELDRSVRRIIGDSNNFSTPEAILFRDTSRNAWIAEGVGHALLILRRRHDTCLLSGTVHALCQMHPRPSRQGLDLFAIYEDGNVPIVALGEAKASRDDGSARLTEAAGFFREIDQGDYDVDVRNNLATLKGVLPPDLANQVSDSLWRDRRCYVPTIVHEVAFSATADRETLARLTPPVVCRRVVVCRLAAFHTFFDNVSDAMRNAVAEVIP